MSSSINEYIKDCTILHKQKEDEVTWSKIDTVFTKLRGDLSTQEDCLLFMSRCTDLLIRSILSERSKLSGTSLELLKILFDITKGNISSINIILCSVLKICGRSNKIVSTRGSDTMVYICKYIDIGSYIKIFSEYYESTNKNIRLAVIKGILAGKWNIKYEKIIEKGKSDQFIEIRNLCKNMNYRKMDMIKKDVDKVIKKDVDKVIKKDVDKVIKKDVDKDFINVNKKEDIVKHSPFKKIPKLNIERSPCNKIIELEKQVRSINSYKSVIKREKPVIKFIKEKKDMQDDLTPKKLDKYLSKYRKVYGNILEETNKKMNEEINENVFEEIKEEMNENVIEEYEESIEEVGDHLSNLSLIEDSQADLKYEYTIMNSEKNEEGKKNKENDEGNNDEIKNENIYDHEIKNENIYDHEIKNENIYDHEIKNENIDDHEIKNENIYDHEIKNENIYDHEIKNENIDDHEIAHDEIINDIFEQSKEDENIVEEIIDNIEKDNNDNINKDNDNIDIINDYKKMPCKEKHSPLKISTSQNRFSALLFADKDECVIYDINAESPLFKSSIKEESSIKKSPKSVINTAVSSSFLYSKDKEESLDNSMVDYTKIDSVVYVDKNIFKTAKD